MTYSLDLFKIKPANYFAFKHEVVNSFLLLFLLSSFSIFGQDKTIYQTQTLKLDEYAVDNVISFSELLRHLDGIANLRQHVLENLEDYPMEQSAIESSRDKEHEAHKRWERYMRKLPVYVCLVDDMNDYIIVDTQISETIEVCKQYTDVLTLQIKNVNNYMINGEIELQHNSFVNFPKDKEDINLLSTSDQDAIFNYISNGLGTFSLPSNSQISISIPITYNCNGNEKDINAINNEKVNISHKIILGGYIFNKEEEVLYRVTSNVITTSSIKLTY